MILRSACNLSGKGVVMKWLLSIAFTLCLAVSTFTSESHATPIEVAFSGVIDSVIDPDGFFGPTLIGTPFSGTYVFDSVGTISILEPSIGTAVYEPNGSISAVVGGISFSTGPISIALADNSSGDAWHSFFGMCNCIYPAVLFSDSTGLKISDETDYFVNTSLVGWDLHYLRLLTTNPMTLQTTEYARGSITSLTIVPEPSIALLFGLGLAGLALRR
jgi:hypothetical protein